MRQNAMPALKSQLVSRHSKAVISNSICLGASGSSSWVLQDRTELFAKENVY